jgi:hypothetical protein
MGWGYDLENEEVWRGYIYTDRRSKVIELYVLSLV